MLLAIVASPLAAFWVALHIGYESGAIEVWSGSVFRRTQSWLNNPMPLNVPSILAMIFGLIFTFVLTAVRLRFLWWPCATFCGACHFPICGDEHAIT